MKLYMKVTNDKYELPLAVAGSFAELARMQGISPSTIYTCIYYQKAHPNKVGNGGRYLTIDVDEGGEDEE